MECGSPAAAFLTHEHRPTTEQVSKRLSAPGIALQVLGMGHVVARVC